MSPVPLIALASRLVRDAPVPSATATKEGFVPVIIGVIGTAGHVPPPPGASGATAGLKPPGY